MTTPESAYVARTLVILNPAAGQVPAERTRRLLGGAFAVRGAAFDLVETAGAGDAARLAREAVARGYRAVAAAGGDGTVAEVISGLAGSSTPLGIIPQGTANQLAFNLGVPSELERAVAVVVHGTPGAVDVGQLADGRYFALMAGAGWDAQVVSAATREQKDRWGFGAYLYAGLRSALALPSARFRITADGQGFEVHAATVLVANVGSLLSGLIPTPLQIAPDASFRDGLLDVCVFAPRSLGDVTALLWKLARRRYAADRRMLYLQAREVRVESEPPLATQLDGDPAGLTPLVARAVPGGVRVLL